MELHDAFDQRQTQPQSPAATIKSSVDLTERVEYPTERLRLHSHACVPNEECGLALLLGFQLHRYSAAGLGKFAGVVQQVAQHLRQANAITHYRYRLIGKVQFQLHAAVIEASPVIFNYLPNDAR